MLFWEESCCNSRFTLKGHQTFGQDPALGIITNIEIQQRYYLELLHKHWGDLFCVWMLGWTCKWCASYIALQNTEKTVARWSCSCWSWFWHCRLCRCYASQVHIPAFSQLSTLKVEKTANVRILENVFRIKMHFINAKHALLCTCS